jgi:hypothetical protein
MRLVARVLLAALPAILLGSLSAAGASAATVQYATRAAWEAAVGSFATEDFDSVPLQVVPQAGGTIAASGFDIVIPGNHGDIGIFGGADRYFEGDIHYCDVPFETCDGPGVPGGDPKYNNLVFGTAITALALDVPWVEDPDEDPETVETIEVHILGEIFHLPAQGFLGITSDVPFTLVHLRASRLFYDLDDVSYAPVPESSTALLVAVGAAGMGLVRGHPGRRRARAR